MPRNPRTIRLKRIPYRATHRDMIGDFFWFARFDEAERRLKWIRVYV